MVDELAWVGGAAAPWRPAGSLSSAACNTSVAAGSFTPCFCAPKLGISAQSYHFAFSFLPFSLLSYRIFNAPQACRVPTVGHKSFCNCLGASLALYYLCRR